MTGSVPPPQPLALSRSTRAGGLLLLLALWLQLYAACIYGWRFGEYYDYGWYVPPLALLFFFRLRGMWHNPPARTIPPAVWFAATVILTLLLTGLRVINRVDPRWTLPLWIQAGCVVTTTLVVLHQLGGWPAARRIVPVLLFACCAIPLPSVIERLAVSSLTDSVIAGSTVVLGWLGRPVEAIGDQLGRMGEVVRITEGCSGIRSAQSFLMVSLFFGEWMRLTARNRWLMVAAGLLTAWTLNVIRAISLSWIRFEHGEPAFDKAHDSAGFLAFAAGSAILLGVSVWLDDRRGPRRLRRRMVEGGAA